MAFDLGVGGVVTLGTWEGGTGFSAVNLKFWRELVDLLIYWHLFDLYLKKE